MIRKQNLIDLMNGDEAMADRFIDMFKNQMPSELEKLENQLAQKSFNAVSITAHSIKSQCGYLGLNSAIELASLIEKKAENGEEEFDFDSAVQRLKNELIFF